MAPDADDPRVLMQTLFKKYDDLIGQSQTKCSEDDLHSKYFPNADLHICAANTQHVLDRVCPDDSQKAMMQVYAHCVFVCACVCLHVCMFGVQIRSARD